MCTSWLMCENTVSLGYSHLGIERVGRDLLRHRWTLKERIIEDVIPSFLGATLGNWGLTRAKELSNLEPEGFHFTVYAAMISLKNSSVI